MKLTKTERPGVLHYAKSINETSGNRVNDGDTVFPQGGYYMRRERALSMSDTRRRTLTSVLCDMPVGKGRQMNIADPVLNAVARGRQVGSSFTLSTAFPLTVVSGSDRSNTGAGFVDDSG